MTLPVHSRTTDFQQFAEGLRRRPLAIDRSGTPPYDEPRAEQTKGWFVADQSTLLYFLYGDSRTYHLELTYSVLSAMRESGMSPDFRIVLMCDENSRRPDLPVEHLTFTEEEFDRWTLGGQYHHAAKVNALIDALSRFGGKLAMIDTDTYFLQNPSMLFERIERGRCLMHADEGTLADQNSGYWQPIINGSSSTLGVSEPISEKSRMFNSGVVGVHDSALSLLKKVVPLMAKLHHLGPSVHNVEQFALGLILGAELELQECPDLVRHYYGYKRPFIHAQLDEMFPAFTKDAFTRQASRPPILDSYPKKATIDLVRARLKRLQRRQPSIYGFAYLAYLSAFNSDDARTANAWATVAIDALRWNDFPEAIVVEDFRRMHRPVSSMPDFLAPEIRTRWSTYWQSRADFRRDDLPAPRFS